MRSHLTHVQLARFQPHAVEGRPIEIARVQCKQGGELKARFGSGLLGLLGTKRDFKLSASLADQGLLGNIAKGKPTEFALVGTTHELEHIHLSNFALLQIFQCKVMWTKIHILG